MAKVPSLARGQVKAVEDAVDLLIDRVKARVLGPQLVPKRIVFTYTPELTLPSLYLAAGAEDGNVPDEEALRPILNVVDSYLDAYRAYAKAQAVRAVEASLKEKGAAGIRTDLQTVLSGRLTDVWGDVTAKVKKMVDTEATGVRNLGTLDAIGKVNALSGIDDPVVGFVPVRDEHLCSECRRLHLLPDGRLRLWRLSEVERGYHVRGVDAPSMNGEHPHCRCSMVTVLPGYGFNAAGAIAYVGPGHDEFAAQRPK